MAQQPVIEVRTAYGLFENRDGRGNGLRDIVDIIRNRYDPNLVRTPINEWTDDIATETQAQADVTHRIWVGHSYAIARMMRTLKQLRGSNILLHQFVLVDGVTRLLWGQFKFNSWQIPADQVLSAKCFFQKNQREPDSSIILNADGKFFTNEDMTSWGVNHCTICADTKVQTFVLESVGNWVRTVSPPK